jgi:hypothetical protein
MARKRTKKEKQKAKHQFNFTWKPEPLNVAVKRQNNIGYEAKNQGSVKQKNADKLVQAGFSLNPKKAILKSLIQVGFILCLELVLYLAWNVKHWF